MKNLLITVAILAAGCSNDEWDPDAWEHIAGQDKAEQIVWHQTYGETGPPPPVAWVFPWRLTCDCTDGTCRGFYRQNACIYGMYHRHSVAEVAVIQDHPFSANSYAHELFHAHLEHATGDVDIDHRGPGWGPGGAVEQAARALQAAGL